MLVFSAASIDGYSHAVATFNNVDNTAFAVVLDPYGVPDSVPYGYAYLFADYYYHQLWGSNDGVNWYVIGSI
ncbi:MAG TPA: hypothetical protein VFG09_15170 [Thermodesulfovibrionales bacterium]|nr:hypothetical protein [Thermodesulfovibrionales bacterium]